MSYNFSIRAMRREDLAGVRLVLDSTGMFPPAMVEAMAEPYLSGTAPHFWLVALSEYKVIGFAYCEPERMTDGTYNLLALGVSKDRQRSGVGAELMRHVENAVRDKNGRLLLVETSSDPAQDGARAFYRKDNFTEEARIRDFYAPGETKVVFWKEV
jgi:ribosomal protein S18 acetylase RimI-like enzyme